MTDLKIDEVQAMLRGEGLDGWLFFDFRGSDPLAYRILGLDLTDFSTRRWYYFIPTEGAPAGLVSRVEPHRLDPLPGRKVSYLSWWELEERLQELLGSSKRIAMQYSPGNGLPYVSRVDAGTVELVRRFGPEVVSSADLVQTFEAVWTPSQWASHQRAARGVRETVEEAFAYVRKNSPGAEGTELTEYEVQQFILGRFRDRGLTTHHPPIVAVNAHSAVPHYGPTEKGSALIRPGDFILIDLWAKEAQPGAVYADITWTAFLGRDVPARHQKIFLLVARARDAAISFVENRFREGRPLYGYEIDRAARQVIEDAGYGGVFLHRTGHSIGEEVHGNGANIDDLETRDGRRILPHTCFSIEPGIYLENEFGVRSEVNVYVTPTEAVVTGEPRQTGIIPLLAS